MPTFNPLANVTGRNAYTLFDIRYGLPSPTHILRESCGIGHYLPDCARLADNVFSLDNDFIVFRGNDHESSGQLLKGTVVLCLPSSLRIEDVHLRLIGTERLK